VGNLHIHSAIVENYKCFKKQEFSFSLPDGVTAGSGLNVLIGENGNGKTTLLEAIYYANQSAYSVESRLQIQDFYDHAKPIQIALRTSDFRCKLDFPQQTSYFECDGIDFQAKSRDRKSPGKLLSSPFSVSAKFSTKTGTYKNANDVDTGKEIPPMQLVFSNDRIDDAELNVFYFDKNRTRQLTQGNYATTFEKICADLNWRFLLGLEKSQEIDSLKAASGDYFSFALSVAQKGTGSKLASEAARFFDNPQLAQLRIDLVDLLHPFTNAFFSVRQDGELKQIRPKDLGSGVEIILTLLLLRNIAAGSKGSIVYLLDEPELHLHPKAQERLAELLIEESKTKQIFISTHSPYLIKGCMSESARKIIFRRDIGGTLNIENAESTKWGGLPWSPSWGEINYAAYDLPTLEYHNELYGHLQEKHNLYREVDVEKHLVKKGVSKSKKWSRTKDGVAQPAMDVTLCTYVRNAIHHPENTLNPSYRAVGRIACGSDISGIEATLFGGTPLGIRPTYLDMNRSRGTPRNCCV
jgi:predicted ATPase